MDLEEVLALGRRRLSDAAKKEQKRRVGRAQTMARQALARLHPDDYRSLYRQAIDMVNAERGPLPGDD